jgi:hypothetical protein
MSWESKGCELCRNWWLQGTYPKQIAISQHRAATLHYCEDCSTYWECFQRYADTIKAYDVQAHYPEIAKR